jgi:mono/diheme cytochrome c family protein
MPPVGDTWTPEEFAALAAYVKKNVYKPAPVGGTSGG